MLNLTYLYRIGLSLLLGTIIGLERETQDKPAGLRTTILVTLGATLFTIISIILRSIEGNYDLGRIIAYCIVGIGFLGAGVIKGGKDGEGVTTASVLWVSVGVGILCGLGEYILAIISTIIIYLVLKLKYIKVKLEIIQNGKKRRKKD